MPILFIIHIILIVVFIVVSSIVWIISLVTIRGFSNKSVALIYLSTVLPLHLPWWSSGSTPYFLCKSTLLRLISEFHFEFSVHLSSVL